MEKDVIDKGKKMAFAIICELEEALNENDLIVKRI